MIGKNIVSFQQTCFLSFDMADTKTFQFINNFLVTKDISDGMIIHNENEVSKIYEEGEMPSLQHMSNFLPSPDPGKENRILMTSNLIQNVRKIGLTCNYPAVEKIQASCKICTLMPFLKDNVCYLTDPSQQQITWVSHLEENTQQDGSGITQVVPYVYQFNIWKWRLQKFDLSGICVQGKTFKDYSEETKLGQTRLVTKEIKDIRAHKVLT